MDILFVSPNFDGTLFKESRGTLLLATILRNAGFGVDVLRFCDFGNMADFDAFLDRTVKGIEDKKPGIVSFYTRCDVYHVVLKMAEKVKALLPNVKIVFGGPQADLTAVATLKAFPYVDYICCGEGETTIVPFFSSLLSGKPDYSIRGLVYRDGREVVKNERPELLADLDVLPDIDYSFLSNDISSVQVDNGRFFTVDVGRGCPFSCSFCSTKNFWGRKYRLKSAERILDDVKDLNRQYGVDKFLFDHDMFTMNRNKVIDVCKGLKALDFPVYWRCSARVDCLDKELIDIMKDSGLNRIYVGIETGSPRMQKLVHKNLKLEEAYEKIAYMSNKGIGVTASFIFGYPQETEEDFAQTMEFMMKLSALPLIKMQVHLCAFFPGTELTAQYCNQLERADVISDVAGRDGVKECYDLIMSNPEIFPQYFEYKSEHREKVKYYNQFFDCWMKMRTVYEYIAQNYYKDRICQMLYDFTERNKKELEGNTKMADILERDSLLDYYRHDENYVLLKDVYAFLLWRLKAENGEIKFFGFDVQSVIDGCPLAEIKRTSTGVMCAVLPSGRKKFKIFK